MKCWVELVVLIGLFREVNGGIKCDYVDPPINGYIKDTVSYQVGGVIAFECNEGFTLNGTNMITCRTDGTWSAPAPPHCERTTCEHPVNSRVKKDEAHFAEEVLELECIEGFTLVRDNQFVCGLDGKWNLVVEPKCEKISCDVVDPPVNGYIKRRTSHRIGGFVEFMCDEGFQLTGEHIMVCGPNGKWMTPAPTCGLGSSSTVITGNEIIQADGRNELRLSCESSKSLPASTITWKFNKTMNHRYQNSTMSSERHRGIKSSQTLTIFPTRNNDGETITCQAQNDLMTEPVSASVTLNLTYQPIIRYMEKITAVEGNNVTLSCFASSKPPSYFGWYRSNKTLATGRGTESRNCLNYTMNKVGRIDSGTYMCSAETTVSKSNSKRDTKSVELEIQFGSKKVTIYGNKKIVADGKNELQLSCASRTSNPASSITWKFNKTMKHRYKNSTTSVGRFGGVKTSGELTLIPTRHNDGETITCEALNNMMNEPVSNSVKLNTTYNPKAYIAGSLKRNIREGDKLVVKCLAKGKPEPYFTWFYNSSPRGHGTEFVIHNVSREDDGYYTCIASNGILPNGTATVSVNIWFPPNSSKLTTEGSFIANGHRTLNLTCTTDSSNPASDIVWTYNSETKDNNAVVYMHRGTNNGYVRSQSLVLTMTRKMDGHKIGCYALYNGSKYAQSEQVVLDLPYNPIAKISGSSNRNIREGTKVVLTCVAEGKPEPNVTWFHNRSPIGHDTVFVISNVSQEDNGNYTCIASNGILPNGTDTVSVNIWLKPGKPDIYQHSEVSTGGTVHVYCSSANSPPGATIVWLFDGKYFNGRDALLHDKGMTGSWFSKIVTSSDNGKAVTCKVDHPTLPTPMLASVDIQVHFPPNSSKLTTEGSFIVNGNTVLNLTCTTDSSNPASDIVWTYNSETKDNNAVVYKHLGTNNGYVRSQYLVLPTTRMMDGHKIGCYALYNGNKYAQSEQVVLNLQYNPIANISWSSTLTVREGAKLVLTCLAEGKPEPNVTWLHNRSPIGHGTEFVISNVSREDYGSYTCKSSNGILPDGTDTVVVFIRFGTNYTTITGNNIIKADGKTEMELHCVSQSSNPPATITWKFNKTMKHMYRRYMNSGIHGGIRTSETLTITPTRHNDGELITCEAQNNLMAEPVSDSVTLNLTYIPIIRHMETITAIEDNKVILTCFASSKPPSYFGWYKSNKTLATGLGTESRNYLNYTINKVSRNDSGTYTCSAETTFFDGNREKDTKTVELEIQYINVCDSQLNKCAFRCVNLQGSITCVCPIGYQLAEDGTHCDDVNECETPVNNCRYSCKNLIGTFMCVCPEGYMETGRDKCTDIDECREHPEKCGPGHCRNTQGGYICHCPYGYRTSPDGKQCLDYREDYCYTSLVFGMCIPARDSPRTKQTECCCTAGVAWGRMCEMCPRQGTYTYRIMCPMGPGYDPDGEDINECTKYPGICVNGQCVNSKGSYSCVCKPGYMIDDLTGQCVANCEMPDSKGGMLKVSGSEEMFTQTTIPHGLQLQLECFKGFELVNSKNEIMNSTLATFKCDQGRISDKYHCKRCQQRQNVPNRNKIASFPKNTEQICVEYEDGGCTITDSSTYIYFDDEGNIIQPPYTVKNGAQVMVVCYDQIVVYDYYEYITCRDGILSPVMVECQYLNLSFDPCEKFQLKNGKVRKVSIEKYNVTCNPGYKLNIPNALNEQCVCFNGEVECVAGLKPKCKVEKCKIPLDIDERLSVYENVSSSVIGFSPGQTIRHNKYAFFNCSNVIEHKYEPFNRRFRCVRGQWIEDEIDSEWRLGNNGAFPECREARCEPPCSNGGICYKDEECRCSHMTAGSRCETILCDDSCILNGGECVKPGVCGNCPNNRRGNNCELENSNFLYVVSLQTENALSLGPRNDISLVIHGKHENTATFQMKGGTLKYRMREIEFRGIDVRPIHKVVLATDQGMSESDELISYVSIYTDVDDSYYVFRHPPDEAAAWLTPSSQLVFTLSKHPERCIHSFEQGINRKPENSGYGFLIAQVTLRACKQWCLTRTFITCNSIYFMPVRDKMGQCYILTHLPESNRFTNTSDNEIRKKYMSYRRVCVNHGDM